jgi:hypothetical protein
MTISMTEPATLWNNRRSADVDRLHTLLPMSGPCPAHGACNVALEIFRQFQNAYYDLFNNGGGNWSVNHKGAGYSTACKVYGFKRLTLRELIRRIDNRKDHYCEELERLGDAVINAALAEQFGETPSL